MTKTTATGDIDMIGIIFIALEFILFKIKTMK
jgi:hypothetical protein